MAISANRNWKKSSSPEYRVAYVMRAVTPGEFVLPGAVIEDMYRAEDYGLTEAGRINILPRNTP